MLDNDDGLKVFSSNLNALFRERNITQKELAAIIGVAPSTISHWLLGAKMPKMSKLDKLCNYFGVERAIFFKPRADVDDDFAPLSSEEKLLIQNYRKIDEEKRRALNAVLSAFVMQQATTDFGNIIQSSKGNSFLNLNAGGNQYVTNN